MKITLDRNSFTHSFIQPISKLCDQCIINILPKEINALVNETSGIILYSKYITETNIQTPVVLNIGNIKKLYNLLNYISSDSIDLDIESNHIKYENAGVKFKYHLFEDGIIQKPTINTAKIEAFQFNTNFTLTYSEIQNILKASSTNSDTNKIYFFIKDGNVYAELTDMSIDNTDSLTLKIADKYNGEGIKEPLPIELEIFRNLIGSKTDVDLKINTQYKVLIFDMQIGNIFTKYIVNCLVK